MELGTPCFAVLHACRCIRGASAVASSTASSSIAEEHLAWPQPKCITIAIAIIITDASSPAIVAVITTAADLYQHMHLPV